MDKRFCGLILCVFFTSDSTGLRIQEDLPDQNYIHLLIVDTLSLPAYLYKNLEEAYTLHVNPSVSNIVIQAQTPAGKYN